MSFHAFDQQAQIAGASVAGEMDNIVQSCPAVTLEIGVFFDGTFNNATNVGIGGGEGSYGNDYSNVYLLSLRYKDQPEEYVRNACGGYAVKYDSLYVEGIGTVGGQEDRTVTGGAMGMGSTGVEAKVFDTCIEIGNRIRILSPGVEPTKIVMDVFGFSRGAAAARYFVNCFRQGYVTYYKNFINEKNAALPEGRTVEFRFIGIFDTVAAIGYGANDSNGPVNVHLSTAQADRIFHLTAANEFRKFFRLNENVPGGGEQRPLPGAHSDVGGGYLGTGDVAILSSWRRVTRYTEQDATNARTAKIAEQPGWSVAEPWVTEGWIDPGDVPTALDYEVGDVIITYSYGGTYWGSQPPKIYSFRYRTLLSRPWVKYGYSRIPLHIMHTEAVASGVPFRPLPNDAEWRIPQELVEKGIAGTLQGGGTLDWLSNRFMLRNYAHVSSTAELGMGPESDRIRVTYSNEPGKAK